MQIKGVTSQNFLQQKVLFRASEYLSLMWANQALFLLNQLPQERTKKH